MAWPMVAGGYDTQFPRLPDRPCRARPSQRSPGPAGPPTCSFAHTRENFAHQVPRGQVGRNPIASGTLEAMAPDIALTWPSSPPDELSTHVHRIIHAVTALGGAVGWLEPPSPEESDAWLLPLLDEVARGDAALCLASADGTPAALGCWRRDPGPI